MNLTAYVGIVVGSLAVILILCCIYTRHRAGKKALAGSSKGKVSTKPAAVQSKKPMPKSAQAPQTPKAESLKPAKVAPVPSKSSIGLPPNLARLFSDAGVPVVSMSRRNAASSSTEVSYSHSNVP